MPEMNAPRSANVCVHWDLQQTNPARHGDCKLTGYCADEDAIDGFRITFRTGETDLETLMNAAFETWLKAAQSDARYQFSTEGYAEHCEANRYEFYENGRLLTD